MHKVSTAPKKSSALTQILKLVRLTLILCICSQTLLASDEDRILTAGRVESQIVIDGILDEREWSLVEPATDFIQNEPNMGEAATERTEVRLLYDDEYLYLGIYCFDSAGREGITVTDISRDYGVPDNDHLGVIFDTFDDDRNGLAFGTNPVGAKRDIQVTQDGERSNVNWNTIWDVKTQITDSGWQVEMAIPFRSLRFRDSQQQVWGINFDRRIRRKNESSHWSPIPRPYRLGRVSLAGELKGIDGIGQGRNFYIKPYLSAPVVRLEQDDVDFLPDAGVDIKYGVTPGLTLDLTVNTDFSQVEADVQQINLTRFPLFFPEKREFFLENATVFQVKRAGSGFRSDNDLIAFFSRRIGLSEGQVVPILAGARLTGAAGPYRLGFLSIQTDESDTTPSTNFSVVRVRRDIFQNSDIGGIFINKDEKGDHYNRTYGVDTNWQFFRYLEAASLLIRTDTPGLQGKDKAYHAFVGWRDPFLEMEAEHLSIEDNFNPEVGFVPRAGIRKSKGQFTTKPRPGETIPWIRQFRPNIGIEYITNQENVLESRDFDQTFSIDFQDGGLFWVTHRFRFERLDEPFFIRPNQTIPVGDYWFREINTNYSSDQSRMFSGNLFFQTGEFFDGHKNTARVGFGFKPGYHFGSSIAWNREDVELPSGNFTTHLVIVRWDYSFNTRMFLDGLIQYNSTVNEISSNIRFNLIYKPLSDFFLVYNERRSTTGEVIERALIAKLTYVFDF